MRRFILVVACLSFCSACGSRKADQAAEAPAFSFAGSPASRVNFLSTQLNPVEEASKMRNSILKDFPGAVDFRPNDNSFLGDQIAQTLASSPGSKVLVGALHGDLSALGERGILQAMDSLLASLGPREFSPSLLALARLGGKELTYLPWMQASFVMVANRKALAYLPKGARLETLSYEELYRWGEAILKATGNKAIGFPVGEKGLMHRFFQGYLYPSFTKSTLLKFRSPEAKAMWGYFRTLWTVVHPASLVYSQMADPLLAGDVWIAWDHCARLSKVFAERPEDFVAFPAPRGPAGRGFMTVVAGLAIPLAASDDGSAGLLADYLTRPEIQARTLQETGFFPVLTSKAGSEAPPSLAALSAAVAAQTDSPDSILTLLPVGLGQRAGDYNRLFLLAFSRIVLEGESLTKVLDSIGLELQAILDEEKVAAWLPDSSGERPARIE